MTCARALLAPPAQPARPCSHRPAGRAILAEMPAQDTTLDDAPLPVVELDAERRVRFANRATAAALGSDLATLLGTRLPDGPVAALWTESVAPYLELAARTRRPAHAVLTTRDGERQDARIEPVLDAAGALTGLTIVVRAEPRHDAAARRVERLQAILDGLPLGVLAVAPRTGMVLDANETAARLVGVDRRRLPGMRPPYPFGDLLPRERGRPPQPRALRAIRGRDGELRPLEVELLAGAGPGCDLVLLSPLDAARGPAAGDDRDEAVRLVAGLTGRQREILGLVARGRGTREIATLLELSEATVKNHVAAVLAALRCSSRTAATALAFRAGLVS